MALYLLTPPSAEPLDLAAVRLHLKVDGNEEDSNIGLYLAAARAFAEESTHRQLVAARYRHVFDCFPDGQRGILRFPVGPVISIDDIHYRDANGDVQTFTGYAANLNHEPAAIGLQTGQSWPDAAHELGAVWVDFHAGHCATFSADPATDTLTVVGWPEMAVGSSVRISNSGGSLPAPLKPHGYFIQAVVGENTYKLSETINGGPVNLTTAGTGTHYIGETRCGGGHVPANVVAWMLIRAETHFSHRGENAVTKGSLTALPHIDGLLTCSRVPHL